jgi:putative DNA methylase
MITFRLADALPVEKLAELEDDPRYRTEPQRRRRIEAYLDAGYGSCHLSDPRVAQVVEGALQHFDGQRYRLLAWVVMPNHVHALIETFPDYAVSVVVHSWKSFTANVANRLLTRRGAFWQVECFDRAIRDADHLRTAIDYIEGNPLKAGLVEGAEKWPHSSAAHRDL